MFAFLRVMKVSLYTNSLDIEQHPMENRTNTREDESRAKALSLSPPKGRLPKLNLIKEGT